MSTQGASFTVHKAAEIWTCARFGETVALKTYSSAALVVDDSGRIQDIGDATALVGKYPTSHAVDHGSAILIPGFIDAHLHAPQLDVIGSGGYALLDWLDHFVFPAEAKYAALDVAVRGARRLTRELVRHGITTAVVFSSSHAHAAEALFQSFERSGLRLVTGKTSMDIGAPESVLQAVDLDIDSQERLIEKWHGRHGRLFYAITPRFALSCSRQMMEALAELRERHPNCYVQTHISETRDEVKDVLREWGGCSDYLSIYEDYGLVGEKTLLAHSIYLSDHELQRVAQQKASIVHCPTSNTFLGSGLFDLKRARTAFVNVCLASDVGAGTSLSPWQTMLECYKVQALLGDITSAEQLLYLATLAGAEALGMSDKVGSLEVGKLADFVVIHPTHIELLGERLKGSKSPVERLFAMITMGDDRLVSDVYVAGKAVSPPEKAHRH
jgi:guanine deaminase